LAIKTSKAELENKAVDTFAGTSAPHSITLPDCCLAHPGGAAGSAKASQAKFTKTPPSPDLLAEENLLSQLKVARVSAALSGSWETVPSREMAEALLRCSCSQRVKGLSRHGTLAAPDAAFSWLPAAAFPGAAAAAAAAGALWRRALSTLPRLL
jgi:hypothetical protein